MKKRSRGDLQLCEFCQQIPQGSFWLFADLTSIAMKHKLLCPVLIPVQSQEYLALSFLKRLVKMFTEIVGFSPCFLICFFCFYFKEHLFDEQKHGEGNYTGLQTLQVLQKER